MFGKFNMEIPNYCLSKLDCSVYQIFERRDLLSGQLDGYCRLPYEMVVSYPESMGERGKMMSLFYEKLPAPEELYKDVRKELRDFIKKENFLTAGVYTPTSYEEQAIKIIRKVLRTAPKELYKP